jgi:hypothetical protein
MQPVVTHLTFTGRADAAPGSHTSVLEASENLAAAPHSARPRFASVQDRSGASGRRALGLR